MNEVNKTKYDYTNNFMECKNPFSKMYTLLSFLICITNKLLLIWYNEKTSQLIIS
jgi:hypothetical protein